MVLQNPPIIYTHPVYKCCAFVGLDNKLYKTHGKYIKIRLHFYVSNVHSVVLGTNDSVNARNIISVSKYKCFF